MLAMPSWKGRPAPAKKLELHLFVHELTGLPAGGQQPGRTIAVQVEWKGNGPRAGIPLRGTKKNHTATRAAGDGGVVRWEEGFRHTCKLRAAAATPGNRMFKSWIINIVIQGHGFRSGGPEEIGKAKLDVATYAREMGQSMTIPLWCFVDGDAARASLMVTLEFFEAGRKDEKAPSALLQDLSLRSFSRRGSSSLNSRTHRRSPMGSTGSEISSGSVFSSSHTTSSSELSSSGEYATANWSNSGHRRLSSESRHRGPALLRALSWSNLSSSFRKPMGQTKRKPQHGPTRSSNMEESSGLEHAASTAQSDMRVRVPQADSLQTLLKQEQVIPAGEATIVDLTASETGTTTEPAHPAGSWERRAIRSRDGRMELTTDVFFASIDQRSEAAAGEGACAVLVTVIADWLHSNMGRLPDQPQLDELVREGSSEWRRLCEDASYLARFADAHFDLETVLEARVRPVMTVTDMSYVGFFRPPGEGTASPEYLLETVPFEIVWDEATRVGVGEERTYIVSWNDHFFVLKATPEDVYIIDTLGERLFEGCDRAYILRFGKDSLIRAVPHVATAEVKEGSEEAPVDGAAQVVEEGEKQQASAGQVLLKGMVAGREFIKEFLAAVPLRELQEEMLRGAVSPDSRLLQRMQIEFHYTISL